MTNQEIIDICTKYNIEDYTINPDGSIDVNEDVDISYMNLTELPIKFNNVNGFFNCSYNQLKNLNNIPNKINSWFDCSYNHITILNYPDVYGQSYCHNNPLESLNNYKGDYNDITVDNKVNLIKKHKRTEKLKLISKL